MSRSPNSIYYPLENDRLQHDCEVLEQFGEAFDTRYISASLEVSEHEAQEGSGVLATLEALPLSTMYLTESIKEDILYEFWSRPTIAWRLECEEAIPKTRIVQAARYEQIKQDLNERNVIAISMVAYITGSSLTFLILLLYLSGHYSSQTACSGDEKYQIIASSAGLSFQFILFLITFGMIESQRDELDLRDQAMRALALVNACGD